MWITWARKLIRRDGWSLSAGNDVYLSLDADLQEAIYNILEQSIAGLLLEKIENTRKSIWRPMQMTSGIRIPNR